MGCAVTLAEAKTEKRACVMEGHMTSRARRDPEMGQDPRTETQDPRPKKTQGFSRTQTCPGRKFPALLGLARKIIRTRAIKNRRFFASKTQKNALNGAQSPRGLRKNLGFAPQNPGFCAKKCPHFFSRPRAKII